MEKIVYKTDVVALKKLMLENHIEKIGQLAEICGVNRNTLGKILNKGVQPSADVMYKLVECLNITPRQAGEIFFSIDFHNEKVSSVEEKTLT